MNIHSETVTRGSTKALKFVKLILVHTTARLKNKI